MSGVRDYIAALMSLGIEEKDEDEEEEEEAADEVRQHDVHNDDDDDHDDDGRAADLLLDGDGLLYDGLGYSVE